MNLLSRVRLGRTKACHSRYLRPSRQLSKRLSVECLEQRLVPAVLTVVPETFSTDALHFHSLQDALVASVNGDSVQVEPGASQSAFLAPALFNNTTLALAAAAGDTKITTDDPITPADVISVGGEIELIDAVAPAAAGHFTLTLHDALANPHTAGTMVTNQDRVGIADNVTVQGDLNAAPATVPDLEVWSGTTQVTLLNLNISVLMLGTGSSGTQVISSIFNSVAEVGGGTGNGQNVLADNTVTEDGFVSLTGNNPGVTTGDKLLNNRFIGGARVLLQEDDGTLVQNNTFTGEPANGVALSVDDSQDVTVAQNQIALIGSSLDKALRVEFVAHATSATILNNTISTSGLGIGIYLNVGESANFEALLQGNDLRGNAVGVEDFGDAVGAGAVDLGGGAAGALGTSRGGNNFRGFAASDTANGVFAVYLTNTNPAATISAQDNIWSVADPTTVIKDGTHNTNAGGGNPGTGSINVGATQLSADQQFVQTLYNDFLERSGSVTELNLWVAQLPTLGQTGVANDIIHSQEGLTDLVDRYYQEYLGRTADPAGQAAWVSVLEHGGTAEQVAIGFLSSPEYYNRATALSSSPDPDANFVQSLYEQLLGRPGSATEIDGWLTQLPTLGRNGVVAGIVGSAEYRTDEVLGLYVTLLHRQGRPSAAELAFWANSNLDLLSIEVQFTGSQEFYTNG
ncbi:MAG TPA: DUF4214 domain-containing protein [Gemmataceae bacterium]|nr:DUF4214 domain-containing protein [Gemmataceae bacterium]